VDWLLILVLRALCRPSHPLRPRLNCVHRICLVLSAVDSVSSGGNNTRVSLYRTIFPSATKRWLVLTLLRTVPVMHVGGCLTNKSSSPVYSITVSCAAACACPMSAPRWRQQRPFNALFVSYPAKALVDVKPEASHHTPLGYSVPIDFKLHNHNLNRSPASSAIEIGSSYSFLPDVSFIRATRGNHGARSAI
jgi:hypothetical protein